MKANESKNKKKLRPRTIVFIGISIAVASLFTYVILIPPKVAVEVVKAKRSTFRETIKVDGVLRSKERFTVPAFADGDIKRIDLKTGDLVRRNQSITELFWDTKYVPVKSPIDGVISKVIRENAGPIRRGDPIIEIVNPNKLEAIAELLTTDATQVKAGNPALIENWGDGPAIQAEVIRVSKAGFIKTSALGIDEEKTEITMDLKNLKPEIMNRLGNTFHVDISIEVSKHDNALIIPIGAIFRDGEHWAVYRIEKGRATKTIVSIPARGNGEAIVSDGINDGESVINYPGDLIKDGTRVKF